MARKNRLQFPYVTLTFVALQILGFIWESRALQLGLIDQVLDDYAFNWLSFKLYPWQELPTLFTHTLLHANVEHLTGNIVFFLVFAPAVERYLGSLLFFVAYIGWGIAAVLTQVLIQPMSSSLIGASGAVSGAAGVFFILYPLRVPEGHFGKDFGWIFYRIPPFIVIGLWFLLNINAGFLSLMPEPMARKAALVAYWAHVGGFAAGAFTVAPFIMRPLRFPRLML